LQGIVPDENFVLVATEVYRLASNQDSILQRIKEATGFTITVLKKESEAFLSLLALLHMYTYPSPNIRIPDIKNDDTILLFDQGGGSTEISYYQLKENRFGEQLSISEVGTNALRNTFFTFNPNGRVNPWDNHNKISTQFRRIDNLVQQKIDAEFSERDGLKKIAEVSQRTHAFAMGTAIKNCLEKMTHKYAKQFNGMSISVSEIERILYEACDELEDSNQKVQTLYKKLISSDNNDRLDGSLLLLYGLPAYLKLLSKFNLSEIRYSYFNLKHGVFLAKYFYGINDVNITNIPSKLMNKHVETKSNGKIEREGSLDKKLAISILYSWAEGEFHKIWVKKLADAIIAKFLANVLLDTNLRPGDDYLSFSDDLIEKADIVLVVCTPELGRRFIEGDGVISYELRNLRHALHKRKDKRVIPILRTGNENESIPFPLKRLLYIDMRDDNEFDNKISKELGSIVLSRNNIK
jgi:hypothetical protein